MNRFSTINWLTSSFILLTIFSVSANADAEDKFSKNSNHATNDLKNNITSFEGILLNISIESREISTSYMKHLSDIYHSFQNIVNDQSARSEDFDANDVSDCLKIILSEARNASLDVWDKIRELAKSQLKISHIAIEYLKDGKELLESYKNLSESKEINRRVTSRRLDSLTQSMKRHQDQINQLEKEAAKRKDDFHNSAKDTVEDFQKIMDEELNRMDTCVLDEAIARGNKMIN